MIDVNGLNILGMVAACVLSVWVADRWIARRRGRRLARFAADRHVRYSGVDRFNLGLRIQPCLPHPGAAEVVVSDVMYRTDQDNHAYVFTATYVTGTTSGHARHRIIAAVSEPRGRSCDCFGSVRAADASLDVEAQYRSLLDATHT